jgi:hypothetical protein
MVRSAIKHETIFGGQKRKLGRPKVTGISCTMAAGPTVRETGAEARA